MNNPYTSRGPLQDAGMFFGRVHELDEIRCFVAGNQSVSMVGPRKIGKSSLLLQLMRADSVTRPGSVNDTLLVYIDCQALSADPYGDLIVHFCRRIAEAMHSYELDPEPALKAAASNPAWSGFEAAVRRLNQRGLRVGLMLDEFEQLTQNPHIDVNFYNALRSAAGRMRLVFITASARPLIELTYSDRTDKILSSPFFNIFAQVFLGLLSESEARSLIRAPMQAAGRTVTPELEDFIYELVGGHPLALQIACFHAWDRPGDLGHIESRTLQDLEAHFQYYWHNLSPKEQEVLRNPAQASLQGTIDPALRLVFRNLLQKCLLVQKHGSYMFASRAWKEFVLAQPQGRAEQIESPPVPQREAYPGQDAPERGVSAASSTPTGTRMRAVLRESLPELLGGLGVAAIVAVATLIYTQFPFLIEQLKSVGSPFRGYRLLLAALGFLGVGTVAAWIALKRMRRGRPKK